MGSIKDGNGDACAALLADCLRRYEKRNPKSLEYHQDALKSLPGGNTRTLLHMSPFPVVMTRGEGSQLFDVDGHEYTDFVGELTAGLYGHSHPKLMDALKNVLDNIGVSLGATNIYEKRFAELLCARFDLETIRFANSGTEANIHCLAAARKFTGKRKIVVFRGGYHGSVLSFGDGMAPNNVDQQDFVISQYNDVEGLQEVFKTNTGIAAVLMEGMQGSGGAIPASIEFITAVRILTHEVSGSQRAISQLNTIC
jgi:glutamate-1-semialdehyde 2,1-aminomutase